MTRTLITFGSLSLVLLASVAMPAQDGNVRARFDREYPDAFNALQTHAQRDGKLRVTKTNTRTTPKQTTKSVTFYTFWRSGENVRVDYQEYTEPIDDESERIFRREMSVVSANGQLFGVGRTQPDAPFTYAGEGTESSLLTGSFNELAGAASGIQDRTVVDHLTHSSVSDLQFTEVEDEGRTLVEARFRRTSTNGKIVSTETIRFDPARDWAVVENRFTIPNDSRYESKITYLDDPPGPGRSTPKLIETYVESQLGNATVKSVREIVFERFEPGTIPDREFSMAAFGLPEVGQPIGDRTRSHAGFWIMGAAIVALIIALALRFQARRWQSA